MRVFIFDLLAYGKHFDQYKASSPAVTGNGLIRVAVPPELNGDIDAQSENGTFRTDFEITILGRIDAHQIRGTIGRGGARIRLQTGNGRIELRKS